MSAFDTSAANPVATSTPESNPDSFVEQLAKAKGEDWRNPEIVAKGKLEADTYISDLERQLTEMREDLSKQTYAKDLLTKLEGQAVTPPPVATPPSNTTAEEHTTVDASDLESLINKTLKDRESKNTADQNVAATDSRLTELYGTEAKAEVLKKAKGLGMSVERMQEIAAESPTAFFQLMGAEGFQTETNKTLTNSVNTDNGFTRNADKNWAYYQNMRRTDSKGYYSPKVQQQLLEDRNRLGDKFY